MEKEHIGIRYGLYKDISNNILRIHVDDSENKLKGHISCEICDTNLIARKGDVKVHHFAHKSGERNCDSWNKPLTEWHLKWQDFFKVNNYGKLEYVIQNNNVKHRTDIYTNKHYCIEIQHSNINHDDIANREFFYGEKMFWIVDGTKDKFKFYFKTQNNYFVGKFNKDYIQSCERTVYIDTDYGLFELIKYVNNKRCIIKKINNIITDTTNLYKCFKKDERKNNDIHKQLYDYMKYNNNLNIIYYCKEYDEVLNKFTDTNYVFDKYLEKIGYVQYLNCSYWESLNNVKEQTNEICLEAIKQDYTNYNFVKNKSYEFNLLAIKQNGSILQFIDKDMQKEDLCLEAVKYNGLNLKHINEKMQTEEICLEALKENTHAFQYIKNKSESMCLKAVKINGLILEYIQPEMQTYQICLEAFKQNKDAIKYINESYRDKIFEYEFKTDKNVFQFIKNKPEHICLEAVRYNGLNLKYIGAEKQTYQICMAAIKQNKNAIAFSKIKNLKNKNRDNRDNNDLQLFLELKKEIA